MQTRSAYGYVDGNPLNHVDPSGLNQYQKTVQCHDANGRSHGLVEQTWDATYGYVSGEACQTADRPRDWLQYGS